jgi:LemA protein
MRSPIRLLALVVALPLLLSSCGYNRLQELDEQVNKAQAQIQTQLQRRADLIDNLVQTVKGIVAQESTVFLGVAEARAKLAGAAATGNLQEMAEANAAMAAPLSRLLALSEASRRIPTSRAAPTSPCCRTSSKARRTGSPWRGRTTTRRWSSSMR